MGESRLPPAPSVRPVEVVLLAAIVAVGAVFVVAESRELWFVADFWGLIDDEPGGLPLLLEPHAGHPSVAHVMGAVIVATMTGLGDAWPWSQVPRVVAWGLLLAALWWVVRRRGADPRVALAMVVVLTAFGSTAWLTGWLPGGPVALASVLLAAAAVTHVEAPTTWQVAGVGALLVLAAASSTTGLLGAVSVVVITSLSGRLRRWWPALLGLVAVNVVWRAAMDQGVGAPSPSLDPDVLLQLPVTALEIARLGYARLLTVPPAAGWIALAGVVVLLVLAAVRRRMDAYDAVVLLWGALYLAATITVRIAAGQAAVTAIRYGYVVVLLTLALVVPRLRLPRAHVATVALVLVATVLGVRNAQELRRGLDFWEARSQASRAVVETAGALVASGEPYVPEAAIDAPRAGMLTTDQVAELVERGWSPERRADEEVVARGDLRVGIAAAARSGTCSPVASGTQLGDVTTLVLRTAGSETVIATTDRHGAGRQVIASEGTWEVTVASGSQVTLRDDDGHVEVCDGQP